MLHGDVILKFNGEDVSSSSKLPLLVARTKIGEKVPVVVWRQGKEKQLNIVLDEYEQAVKDGRIPGSSEQIHQEHSAEKTHKTKNHLGMHLSTITDTMRKEFNIPEDAKGVLITKIEHNSIAENAGLKPRFIISEVEGKKVETPDDILNMCKKLRQEGKDQAMLYVWVSRHKYPHQFVVLPLTKKAEKRHKENFSKGW